MAYIGIQPAESFTSFATQTFSVSATTSYTLDHAVANENEIALFVNNVRQQPGSGKAYTASSTTLTLSAATATTDTMYCVFLGRALQTVTPATNRITAAMVGNDLISGKDALTSSPADTDELLISDAGVLKRIDVSLVGGANTPYFEAYLNSNQSISNETYTKVQFNTETYDTASDYDNSTNYRYTPTTSGKYYVYTRVQCDSLAASNLKAAAVEIRKNGSTYFKNFDSQADNQSQECNLGAHGIITMNGSSDYLEVFGYVQDESGSPRFQATSSYPYTIFGAFKIIE